MKLKIQKVSLGVSTVLMLITIIEYHFFYLFSYNRLMRLFFEKAESIMIATIALFMFLYVYLNYPRKLNKYYGNWMFRYGSLLLIAMIILYIISFIKYPNQSIAETLVGSVNFLYPLFMPAFALVFIKDDGIDKLLRFINIVCLIWYILLILQSISYATTGTLLFSAMDMFEGGSITRRENNLRMGSGVFGNIMVVYNFVKSYCRKDNEKIPIFNAVLFVLGLYCAVVVQQTRAMIIVLFGCIGVVVLFYGVTFKQNIIKAISIIAIGIYLSTENNVVIKLISTFSNPDYRVATTARVYAYSYYFDIFKNSPLYGFAFCADKGIIHGPLGIAYTSDVGYVGLLATTGLFSIIIYIWPLAHMAKLMLRRGFKKLIREDILLLALMVYLILTSATAIITHTSLCFGFSFILAVFEYKCRVENISNNMSSEKKFIRIGR